MNTPKTDLAALKGLMYFVAGLVVAVTGMVFFQRAPGSPSDSKVAAPVATAESNSRQSLPEESKSGTTRIIQAGEHENFTLLASAIADSNRDRRYEALRHLAETVAAHDVKAALDMSGRITDGNDKIEFLRAVFAKWAEREPARALAQALLFPAGTLRAETLNGALNTWAGSEPRAALTWLDANVGGPLKEESLVTIAMSWAGKNPEAASEWFTSTGSTSQAVINGLVSAWADLDPRAASQWVESLRDPDNKHNARMALASEWAGQSPERAAEYITPLLAEKGGADIADALVNAWVGVKVFL